MTREQHDASRELAKAEAKWLKAYGWHESGHSWNHPNAPQLLRAYSQSDALLLTRAEPLRFGVPR